MTTTINADTTNGVKITSDTSGVLGLQTNGNTAVTIDGSQNVGVRVTPSSWSADYVGLQVRNASLASYTSGAYTWVGSNWYNNSGNKYIGTGFATLYEQTDGKHAWLTAASGTAGNAITFTQAMILDASGNLGVGITSPLAGYRGHFVDTRAADSVAVGVRNLSASGITRFVLGNDIGYARFTIGYNGSTFASKPSTAWLGTEGSEPLWFKTNDTERIRIDSAGNVGIGTTTPANKLDVRGTLGIGTAGTSSLNSLTIDSNVGSAQNHTHSFSGPSAGTNDDLTFYLSRGGGSYGGFTVNFNGTNRFFMPGATLNNNGDAYIMPPRYLGIGTTTPTAKINLSIINSDAATTGLLVNTTAATYPGTSNFIAGKFVNNHFGDSWGLWVEANQGSYGACTGIYAKGSIVGAVASGVHGYCEHSNPGGFGTAIGGQFVAHGNLAGGATNGTMIGVLAKCTSVATSTVGYASYALKLETNLGPTSSYGCNYVHNSAQVFILNSNGGISNYSGNNVNLSDEREKKNILLAGDYLSKICAIPIKTFNYNNDAEGEQVTLGVIAQEVEAIAPEFVSESEWEYGSELNSDGAPISLKRIRKGIYETDMMFAIMKSVQELNAKHEALKLEFEDVRKEQQALITQLQADVAALKGA